MNVDGLVTAYHVHALDRDRDRHCEVNRVNLVRLRQDRVSDIDGLTPFVLLAICA